MSREGAAAQIVEGVVDDRVNGSKRRRHLGGSDEDRVREHTVRFVTLLRLGKRDTVVSYRRD